MKRSRLSNRWMLPLCLLAALCISGCGSDGQPGAVDSAPVSDAQSESTPPWADENAAFAQDTALGIEVASGAESAEGDDAVADADSHDRSISGFGDTKAETSAPGPGGPDLEKRSARHSGQSAPSSRVRQNSSAPAVDSLMSEAKPDGTSLSLSRSPSAMSPATAEPENQPLSTAPESRDEALTGDQPSPAAEPRTRIRESELAAGAAPAADATPPPADRGIDTPKELSVSPTFKLSARKQQLRQLDLLPGEELWVIARDAAVQRQQADDAIPGSGALVATLPGQKTTVPVPLKHTDVKAEIDGYVATVNVQQQFHNPYDTKIEAAYVFPLPQDAAVNEFVMTVGKRKIRGIIRERQQAERVYAAAKARGHVAALMTQERPNIFTQKVANIEPGKQIDIDIRYFNTLPYHDGQYEFVFPMVVGPRFNPAAGGDGIGAAARGKIGSSGQSTEVAYLAPEERSGHDISMSVTINAGVPPGNVHSVNHAIEIEEPDSNTRIVQLSASDTIPNRDFVLRYQVAGDNIRTALMTHKDDHGQYFTMMLYPPADLAQVNRSPMEMVFVLDCSGSMKGKPLAQAKAAISHALQSLNERDTFQIIRFSNNASQLGTEPLIATSENIRNGLQYLTSLNGTGGTHMIEGIRAALDFPHDEGRFRVVSFMTDGFIGNEQQILQTLHNKRGTARVFSFGVGSSPNRFLMDRMAIVGRGAVAYLSLNDDAVAVMENFNQRISHPALTDIAIDWGNMQVTDVYPERLPDLIVGRPVIVTGRYRGNVSPVTVNGRMDLQPTSFVVETSNATTGQHSGIAAVWARLKIKDMMNIAGYEPAAAKEIRESVLQTALNYNLMSAFTAFVAVDSLTRTAGDFGTTVAVPVPVPDGVRYDTTVPETN